jgi:hypothetical protein
VPTVVVGTDEFLDLARLEARNRGLPDLPLAVVRHPLGGIPEEEVLGRVDAALAAVVAGLTAAPRPAAPAVPAPA